MEHIKLRIVLCKPLYPPTEMYIDGNVETIMKLLAGDPISNREPIQGWFSVMGLENQLLLYCLEHPVDQAFNRMVKNRPIFGNFLISKFDSNGAKRNLSNDDVNYLMNDLLACKPNTTN